MRRLVLLLPLCAALALAAAGCGGGDDNGGGSTTTSGGTSAAASSGGEVEVKMQNIQFAPKDVTVKVGQKVKWVNEDSVDHNVVADTGADFDSDEFGKGGTFEFTPDKAGNVTYECTLHAGMVGTLHVQQ